MSKRIDTADLVTDLKRVTNLLGKPPTYDEMKQHGKYGPASYQRRFGTWEDVKRLVGWIPDYETFKVHDISPEDGMWLSGFIDGEGCFRLQRASPSNRKRNIHSYSPIFAVSTRADDLPALNELRRIIGSKSKFHIDNRGRPSDTPNAKPAFKFFIRDIPTLAYHLIPILERFPLRTRKKNDLTLFKIAVNTLMGKRSEGRHNSKYTDDEAKTLEATYWALREIKKYEADLGEIIERYKLTPVS